jgi:hypothetical protein
VTVFVNAAQLTLLVAMVSVADIRAVVMTRNIQEEDATIAWVWAGVFAVTSLLVIWSFGRLV